MMAIVDDVLADPLTYRAMALRQRFQTVQDGAVEFHGMAPCADPTVPIWIRDHYPDLTPTLSFFRRSPLGQAEPHYIHTDASMGSWTALLYLNPDPPVGDGTVFWRHRETWADAGVDPSAAEFGEEALSWFDANQWEPIRTVVAQFNRLVLFPATAFHSRALHENYGEADTGTARLLQVIFGTGDLT